MKTSRHKLMCTHENVHESAFFFKNVAICGEKEDCFIRI